MDPVDPMDPMDPGDPVGLVGGLGAPKDLAAVRARSPDMLPEARARQSGSAILTAMLTVTLVATLSTSALWLQWRSAEQETYARSSMQAHWILNGALDWARLILREDARLSSVDHLSEPWAIPLQEARLSTFLAALPDSSTVSTDVPEVFLSGHIIDLQSRLNVANLVQGGSVDPASLRSFTRLFKLLKLPGAELTGMIEQLRLMQTATNQNTASMQGSSQPLTPQETEQLAWLGLSPTTIDALRPFITLLPAPTPVNLNTAPAEVLYAAISELEFPAAQRFVTLRDQKHLNALAEVKSLGAVADPQLNDAQHAVSTHYFEVHCMLRTEELLTQEVSVLQREGLKVQVLSRRAAPYQTQKNPA